MNPFAFAPGVIERHLRRASRHRLRASILALAALAVIAWAFL